MIRYTNCIGFKRATRDQGPEIRGRRQTLIPGPWSLVPGSLIPSKKRCAARGARGFGLILSSHTLDWRN
jgi:hypothetical protein